LKCRRCNLLERVQGFGGKRIAGDLGVGVGTVLRHAEEESSKIQKKVFGTLSRER